MLCEFTFEKESDTLMKEKIKIGFVGAGKVGCSLGILFSLKNLLLKINKDINTRKFLGL